jgi:putative endonuclease
LFGHAEFVSASHQKGTCEPRGILKQVQDDKRSLVNLSGKMGKQGHVYIMSNKHRTTFYIGVTSDLESRVWQHSNGEGSVFTKKYRCYDLVYYECFPSILDAIDREKQLKNWHRPWKIALIESVNPLMKDLKDEIKT